MTACLERNGKPTKSPRNLMFKGKAVCAATLNQRTPQADTMTALGTLEPQSAFLFGYHPEVIALHAIRASDGIWHSLSATKGSVTLRPTPLPPRICSRGPSKAMHIGGRRPCRARVPERRWIRYTKIVPALLMSCSAKVPRCVARECRLRGVMAWRRPSFFASQQVAA